MHNKYQYRLSYIVFDYALNRVVQSDQVIFIQSNKELSRIQLAVEFACWAYEREDSDEVYQLVPQDPLKTSPAIAFQDPEQDNVTTID